MHQAGFTVVNDPVATAATSFRAADPFFGFWEHRFDRDAATGSKIEGAT